MLMIFYKARVAGHMSPPGLENEYGRIGSSDRLVQELRQGLERIIGAVSNYTIGFEALTGMRGKELQHLLFFHSLLFVIDLV